MKLIFLGALYTTLSLEVWGFTSPFASSVEGLSIPNSHYVDNTLQIIRGMHPLGKVQELVDLGVSDILIFKAQSKKEVDTEISQLLLEGYSLENITHIPFIWKDIDSYKESCEQVIQALKLMEEVYLSNDRKLFFHCTVGEDRTGLLAGVWRMLSQDWSANEAFEFEMCENGYGRGNPQKPYTPVVKPIRKELTPLFDWLAMYIETGNLRLGELDLGICEFADSEILKESSKRRCEISSLYPGHH